jgi:hypothetical protein
MTKDEALDLALAALEYIHEGANNQGPHTGISWRCVAVKAEPAITAIKQARSAPVQENTMIYRTFEQWMNGNFLEVKEPRKKAYSKDELLLVEMGWNYGYDAGRAVEQALDKMAENARELGLDYEPVLKDNSNYRYDPPVAEPVGYVDVVDGEYVGVITGEVGLEERLYTTPPAARRQWVGLTDEDYHTNMFSITSLGACDIATIKSIAKDVEAKLKEKNNG